MAEQARVTPLKHDEPSTLASASNPFNISHNIKRA